MGAKSEVLYDTTLKFAAQLRRGDECDDVCSSMAAAIQCNGRHRSCGQNSLIELQNRMVLRDFGAPMMVTIPIIGHRSSGGTLELRPSECCRSHRSVRLGLAMASGLLSVLSLFSNRIVNNNNLR